MKIDMSDNKNRLLNECKIMIHNLRCLHQDKQFTDRIDKLFKEINAEILESNE